MKHHYILTGGPGIGKTTVITLLAEMGFCVIPEVARIIISEQEQSGGVFPWTDPDRFQTLVAARQIQLESETSTRSVQRHIFQDRGLIDGYGYCQHFGTTPPAAINDTARTRYTQIFLLEPLPTYVTDEARKEDHEEAQQIHLAISAAYRKFGYEPVHVPAIPPDERVAFILDHI